MIDYKEPHALYYKLKTTNMKKTVAILTILFLVGFLLYGCSSLHNPTNRHALITLAGGAAGALVTFNAGGAIVGAFVADIVNLTAIKYEDKQLEDREEASRRVKDRFKAEKKEENKKAEELKEDNKKAEKEKKEERRVQLFIENSSVINHNVKIGSIAEANVQYTLLAPLDMSRIRIIETRILHTTAKRFELDRREINRAQGTYISTIKFPVPENIPKGYCILFTTISDGTHAKTTRSIMNII